MSTLSQNPDFILDIGIPYEHTYLPGSVKKFGCEHYQYLFLSIDLGRLSHHKEPPPTRRLLDVSPTFVDCFISCFISGRYFWTFRIFFTAGLKYFSYDFLAKNLFSQPKHMFCELGTLKNRINEIVPLNTKAYVYTDGLQ